MCSAAAVAVVAAVLAAVTGSAAEEFKTYRSLMEEGARLCKDSPYYNKYDADYMATYCPLKSVGRMCLKYCINEKLGMQMNETWNINRTTTLLSPLLQKEYYAPGTKEEDIKLDIKRCIEKSMLPRDEFIRFKDCDAAEYVHSCIEVHFPVAKLIECHQH